MKYDELVKELRARAWQGRFNIEAADAITTLQAELEQCREDAERYAWLRAEHDRIDPLGRVCWKRYDNRNGSEWCEVVDLDAAIDKAMESV